VPSPKRTIAVGVPALVVVAVAWLRLEQPVEPLSRALVLLLLALAAALPRRHWLRFVAAVAATVAAARIAVGIDLVPWRLGSPGAGFGLSDAFSNLGSRFGNGFTDFYGTHLPFDPRVHVAMNELVLSGLFVFALGVTLLVAARKPVAAALLLLLGAGWPATLLGPSRGIAMGAAILCAVLVVLAGLGSRRVPALALPAAVVLATAAVVVGTATAARHGLVAWQSWNLAHVAGSPTDVGFVWDAQYGGLEWSGHPNTVLQVESDRPPSYLRAAVLDDFVGDGWSIGPPRGVDSLEPRAALRMRNETPEVVTVTSGLSDTQLVGGSIPIRFKAIDGAPLVRPEPGFASLNQNLPQGFRYTVWSYTRRPSASALRRSSPQYPAAFSDEGLLDVGRGVTMPAFGTPNRGEAVQALLTVNPDLNPYVPLARLADAVAGRAHTPYGAVVDLENWFVSSGVFHYANHPLVINPPLVGFVTKTHAGYCQYFAGAMTLMLRYLGIPARVAVGFAGGTYDRAQNLWDVTDREAHAWVEVWFKGYGWLPFDPTPAVPGAAPRPTVPGTSAPAGTGARGSASSTATHTARGRGSSTVANALSVKNGFKSRLGGSHARPTAPAERLGLGGGGGGTDRGRPILLLLLVLAGAVGAIALVKACFRLIRGVRRDPHGVAAACRQELAAFLVDQRIEAPHSATLGELGEVMRREFGVAPESFVAAANAARFGRADDAAAAAHTARRELRALLEGARRGLTRRERIRGLFSLRSLARPTPVDA